jgi:putative hydrolase of the HAD superfamily
MTTEIPELALESLFARYSSPMLPEPSGLSPDLPRLTEIRTVLFDIYGTLVISGSGDIGTVDPDGGDTLFRNMLADELGVRLPADISIGAMVRDLISSDHEAARAQGVPYPEVEIRSVWRRLLDRLGAGPDTVGGTEPALAALLYELSRNRVWPMPGAREIIGKLQGRFLLGIVSNAQFYTPPMLNHFFKGQISAFDPELCVWSYREGRAKPDRRLFDRVIDTLRRRGDGDAESTLYIGNDMLNDIQSASASGMKTLLFAGDRRSLRLRENDPRVAGVLPEGILTDLNQLAPVLGVSEVSV